MKNLAVVLEKKDGAYSLIYAGEDQRLAGRKMDDAPVGSEVLLFKYLTPARRRRSTGPSVIPAGTGDEGLDKLQVRRRELFKLKSADLAKLAGELKISDDEIKAAKKDADLVALILDKEFPKGLIDKFKALFGKK